RISATSGYWRGAQGRPASTGKPTKTPAPRVVRRNSCVATWRIRWRGASSARRCSSSTTNRSSASRSCRCSNSGSRAAGGEPERLAGGCDLRALLDAQDQGPVGAVAIVRIAALHPGNAELGEARIDQVAAVAVRQQPAADRLIDRGVARRAGPGG